MLQLLLNRLENSLHDSNKEYSLLAKRSALEWVVIHDDKLAAMDSDFKTRFPGCDLESSGDDGIVEEELSQFVVKIN